LKKALITGITGQDGSFLAELLLEKGYEVHGIFRTSSSHNTERIDHIYNNIYKHYGDLTDTSSLTTALNNINPDEVYNLACQSHVQVSYTLPYYTTDVGYLGTLTLLEAVKAKNNTKYYQASSSEMFGNSESPQNENTVLNPRSPYALSKVASHYATKLYREAYNLYTCNGICFNHESERRGITFVTRKITRAASRIKYKLQDKLILGNIDASRDWGYAKDYVEAMWLMLQQDTPNDYIIATGETQTIKEFLDKAFSYCNLNYKDYLIIDKSFYRPLEVNYLLGNYTKLKEELRWQPKTDFNTLVSIMMEHDLKAAYKEAK